MEDILGINTEPAVLPPGMEQGTVTAPAPTVSLESLAAAIKGLEDKITSVLVNSAAPPIVETVNGTPTQVSHTLPTADGSTVAAGAPIQTGANTSTQEADFLRQQLQISQQLNQMLAKSIQQPVKTPTDNEVIADAFKGL